MQCNHLRADQVIARCQLSRDLEVDLAAALVHILDAPVVVVSGSLVGGGRRPAVLIDLEPSCGAVGLGRVRDSRHVHEDGSVVVPANGFVGAGAIAGLLVGLYDEYVIEGRQEMDGGKERFGYLVHFDGDGVASVDGTFPRYA